MKKLSLLIVTFGMFLESHAGVEPEIKSYITSSALTIPSPLPKIVTYDPVFYSAAGYRNGTLTSTYSKLLGVCNLTWLEINQSTMNDCARAAFSFSVDIKIEMRDEDSTNLTTQYATLTVNSDKTSGVKYTDKHSVTFYGGYYLNLEGNLYFLQKLKCIHPVGIICEFRKL